MKKKTTFTNWRKKHTTPFTQDILWQNIIIIWTLCCLGWEAKLHFTIGARGWDKTHILVPTLDLINWIFQPKINSWLRHLAKCLTHSIWGCSGRVLVWYVWSNVVLQAVRKRVLPDSYTSWKGPFFAWKFSSSHFVQTAKK